MDDAGELVDLPSRVTSTDARSSVVPSTKSMHDDAVPKVTNIAMNAVEVFRGDSVLLTQPVVVYCNALRVQL